MSLLSESRKAAAACAGAAAGAVITAATDGIITGTEWVVAFATGVVAGAAVWAIPNAAPKTPDVQED